MNDFDGCIDGRTIVLSARLRAAEASILPPWTGRIAVLAENATIRLVNLNKRATSRALPKASLKILRNATQLGCSAGRTFEP